MTNKQPTQAQWEEVLKWAGFWFDGTFWVYCEQTAPNMHLHLPTLDLNNLFKWVVPKLRAEYDEDKTLVLLADWIQEVAIHYDTHRGKEAEYLLRAIWEEKL